MRTSTRFMARGFITAALAAPLLASSPAHAAPQAGALYVGALAGVSFINNDVGTKLGVGFRAGSQFHELMNAGLYVSYNSLGENTLSAEGTTFTQNSNLWLLALEGNYELKEFLPGAYVGAKLGVGRTKTSIETTDAASIALLRGLGIEDVTSTDLAAGPTVGYHVSVQPNITFGAEASFLIVTTSDTTNLFNVMGTATIWF